MRTKFNVFLTLLLALVVQITFAQEKVITGVVTEEGTGEPIPGANIVIKGTNTGTATDFDGKFTLKAKEGDVLVISVVGYQPVEIKVGASNTINVTLKEGDQLEEIVVTAQGIKKEKKALGYAVSNVKSEKLEQKAEGDIARILDGKTSGVQIVQQNGLSGSGTNILIRGMNSFSGSNRPLFVIDGIPFASDTNAFGDFVDGNNGSSRFLDLDPNNIANISILKGLAATTLYGAEGRNGVVLITTKTGKFSKGKKKNEISITSSYFRNEIATLPNYQNEYGGGFNQAFGWFYSNWGPAFRKEGIDGWGRDPYIDSDGTVPHPYSIGVIGESGHFPEYAGVRYPYKAYENNVADFFRMGTVQNISLNAKGLSDDGKYAYNLGVSRLDDSGFTPGNNLDRTNFSIGGKADLTNNFKIQGTLNYVITNYETPPIAASYGSNVGGSLPSVFGNLFYTPRSIDLMNLPYQDPVTGESVYYRGSNDIQHPLWTVHNTKNAQNTNRVYGGITFGYDLTDNLKINYRMGLDIYNESNLNSANKGGKTGSEVTQSGIYETWNNNNRIMDYTLMLLGNTKISDDFKLDYTIGSTLRTNRYNRQGVASSKQVAFNVLNHSNFINHNAIEYKSKRNTLGVYAQAQFGYKDYLYATLAGRNDWVSNLDKANRSLFYPSASLSFIPTSAIGALKESDLVNYLKLRVGYGSSANFPSGYPVSDNVLINTHGFKDGQDYVITNTVGNTLPNPDLKPELLNEFEVGFESKLIKNKLKLDFSYYSRKTTDLIISRPLDPSTGYTSTLTNIGEINNTGYEVDLNYDLFNTSSFKWNSGINFSSSEAVVVDLGQDTDKIVYAGFSDLGNVAMEGEPLGSMIGSKIDRDADGNFIVGEDGKYRTAPDIGIIGNATPDFIMNFNNEFKYKNLSLGVLVHWSQGGDVYSTTVATLLGRGVVNLEGVDRKNSFILPGVTTTGEPNTKQINNSSYFFNTILYGPDEMRVYDATVVRLQELSLTYNFSKKVLKSLPFGALSISITGNNLWFYAPGIPKDTNFDPEVNGLGVGNGSGFEYLNAPKSRRYGLSVKATF